MKNNPEFSVKEDTTLLNFLLECFNNKSRNYVKGILKRGQVTIDKKVCTDYARALHPGQRVEVLLGKEAVQYDMKIPVIYEDDDIIAINKPAGMLAISTDKERINTAYHIVRDYIKSKTKSGRIFIVHRLDRDTSGVMMFAKNEQAKNTLQENWDDNAIERSYIAVVEGRVEAPEDRIVSWLKQTRTLFVYSGEKKGDGKMAITNYQMLKTTDKYSLLHVSLETGRKNQIRVHMKDIGHSIAGDKKYGALTDPFSRLGLHASVLVFKHPSTGEPVRLESDMPNAFSKVF